MPNGDDALRAHLKATPLVFQRFLRAAITLIDDGKAVTYGNLAKQLGRAKQVVWKFVKRHPEVLAYVEEQVTAANAQYLGLVVRRHAMLGMQGSVPSAELYLKHSGGHFSRPLGPGDGVPFGGGGVFHLNLLVPRPEYPGLPAPSPIPASPVPAAIATPPAAAVAGGLIPRPNIPRVAVR